MDASSFNASFLMGLTAFRSCQQGLTQLARFFLSQINVGLFSY